MSAITRDRISAIENCLNNIVNIVKQLPDEKYIEAKRDIGHEFHLARKLLDDTRKASEITEERYAQLLQMLGATNQAQAGKIIGELQADALGRAININTIRAAEDFIAKHSHAWNTETVHPNTLVTALRAMLEAQRTKIDPAWSLHDRVEFALRDAGFDLDEAAHVAELASSCEAQGPAFMVGNTPTWRNGMKAYTVSIDNDTIRLAVVDGARIEFVGEAKFSFRFNIKAPSPP